MAVFKSLKPKNKSYIFKFAGNEKLNSPARAVFVRFPLPDETFVRKEADINFQDVNFEKVGKKDPEEVQKLFGAFINNYTAYLAFKNVDVPAFLRECIEHFENLFIEIKKNVKQEVKTIDQFLEFIPEAAVYEIARDLYLYSRENEDFSMGEGKA